MQRLPTSHRLRPGWQEEAGKEDMGDEKGMTNKALPQRLESETERAHAAAALHDACNQLTHELATSD